MTAYPTAQVAFLLQAPVISVLLVFSMETRNVYTIGRQYLACNFGGPPLDCEAPPDLGASWKTPWRSPGGQGWRPSGPSPEGVRHSVRESTSNTPIREAKGNPLHLLMRLVHLTGAPCTIMDGSHGAPFSSVTYTRVFAGTSHRGKKADRFNCSRARHGATPSCISPPRIFSPICWPTELYVVFLKRDRSFPNASLLLNISHTFLTFLASLVFPLPCTFVSSHFTKELHLLQCTRMWPGNHAFAAYHSDITLSHWCLQTFYEKN